MQLHDLLSPQDVLADLSVSSKPDLLRALAQKLAKRAGISAPLIEKALLAREDLGSTGIGRGIALPHARVAGARANCAVFARLGAPIEFAAIDGAPVDLVCAIVSPDQPRSEALTALAAVSKVLRDAATVQALRASTESGSMHVLLVKAESLPPRT